MSSILMSARRRILLYQGSGHRFPVVTLELATKWYVLHVVHPDGRIEEVPFPMDERVEGSPFVDHAPNPLHVCSWAKRMGYSVDNESLEFMIGRWELESGAGRYDKLFEMMDPEE